jgi:hypothetical protein
MADDLKEYMRAVNRARAYPNNAFEHAASLIDVEDEGIVVFAKIVDKQTLLSNISDNHMLRLYQNDVNLLGQMIDMGLREPQLQGFVNQTYYTWRAELSLTRTKEGAERGYQAVPGGYQPNPDVYSGYGSIQPGEQKDNGNIFKQIASVVKGRKVKQMQ